MSKELGATTQNELALRGLLADLLEEMAESFDFDHPVEGAITLTVGDEAKTKRGYTFEVAGVLSEVGFKAACRAIAKDVRG